MKKTLLASMIVVGGLAGIATFAFQGTPGTVNPNPTNMARHEEMQKALETKDYQKWKSLVEGKLISDKINSEEDFNKLLALKEAHVNGDMETHKKLKEELNLGMKNGSGKKHDGEKHNGNKHDCHKVE